MTGMLSYQEAASLTLPCGGSGGCEALRHSPVSHLGTVPIAYLGFLAYLALLALSVTCGLRKNSAVTCTRFNIIISGSGLIVSISLTAYSIFFMGTYCTWCLTSGIIMSLSFAVHSLLWGGKDSSVLPSKRGTVCVACLCLCLCILLFGVFRPTPQGNQYDRERVANVTTQELLGQFPHNLGPSGSRVKIFLFADLQCPACTQAIGELRSLVRDYTGLVVHYRHFPLKGHPLAKDEAILSEVAAHYGKFWEFIDYLHKGFPRTREDLQKTALAFGLPRADCDEETNVGTSSRKLVETDLALADSLALSQTPTIIVVAPGVKPRVVEPANLQKVLRSKPYSIVSTINVGKR